MNIGHLLSSDISPALRYTKSYSLLEVAKMFKSKIKFLPKRPGERYVSALVHKNLSNKIYKYFGEISLKKYIKDFIKNN